MRAYVTSIFEPTVEVCIWALERNGFEVRVIEDHDSLASKLKHIYETASEPFLRLDADVIVNKNMTPDFLESLTVESADIWWWQFVTFDWFKCDINHSMAFILPSALPALRENIDRFQKSIRPETDVSRIAELHNPRRMATWDDDIMGIHGYGIRELTPVKRLKELRNQSHLYDFELAERLNRL